MQMYIILLTILSSVSLSSPDLETDAIQELTSTQFTHQSHKEYNNVASVVSNLKRRLQTLSLDAKRSLLDTHNNQRSQTALGNTPGQPKATNMNRLFWDPALAQVAQDYANQCIWAHNGDRSSQLESYSNIASFTISDSWVGENLFASSAQVTEANLVNGVTAWFNEYQDYTYANDGCAENEVCGHYTQNIWASTRYIGCAYNFCSSGLENLAWSQGTILVCNYYFGGNGNGKPYKEAATTSDICSQCDGDRQLCIDGLCDGCMDPDFPSTSTAPTGCTDGLERPYTAPPTSATLAPIPTPQPTQPANPDLIASDFGFSSFNGDWQYDTTTSHPSYTSGYPLYRKGTSDYYFFFNPLWNRWLMGGYTAITEGGSISYYTYCSTNGMFKDINTCGVGSWSSNSDAYVIFDAPATTTTTTTKTPTRSPTKSPTRSPIAQTTTTTTKSPTKGPTIRPTSYPTKSPTKSPTRSPVPPTTTTNTPTKMPVIQTCYCQTTNWNKPTWTTRCGSTNSWGKDEETCLGRLQSNGDNKCEWICE